MDLLVSPPYTLTSLAHPLHSDLWLPATPLRKLSFLRVLTSLLYLIATTVFTKEPERFLLLCSFISQFVPCFIFLYLYGQLCPALSSWSSHCSLMYFAALFLSDPVSHWSKMGFFLIPHISLPFLYQSATDFDSNQSLVHMRKRSHQMETSRKSSSLQLQVFPPPSFFFDLGLGMWYCILTESIYFWNLVWPKNSVYSPGHLLYGLSPFFLNNASLGQRKRVQELRGLPCMYSILVQSLALHMPPLFTARLGITV